MAEMTAYLVLESCSTPRRDLARGEVVIVGRDVSEAEAAALLKWQRIAPCEPPAEPVRPSDGEGARRARKKG